MMKLPLDEGRSKKGPPTESFFLFLLALELLDEGRDMLVEVGTVNREFWLLDA